MVARLDVSFGLRQELGEATTSRNHYDHSDTPERIFLAMSFLHASFPRL
jgi:hypothetical protein